jgi:hypothetical protein
MMVSVILFNRSSSVIEEKEFKAEGAEKKSLLRTLNYKGLFSPLPSLRSL